MSDYTGAPMYRQGSLEPSPGYITDAIADDAVDFIGRAAADDSPFCSVVGFTAPHSPWVDQHPAHEGRLCRPESIAEHAAASGGGSGGGPAPLPGTAARPFVMAFALSQRSMSADRAAPRTTVAGALLATARVRAGLSQRELAARAGVAQSTVARIESGHADPAFSTLERLVAAASLEMRIRLEPPDDQNVDEG